MRMFCCSAPAASATPISSWDRPRRLYGYRFLVRIAATLVSELELAQQELRLPKLLTHLQRFDLILFDEVGYLPFS